MGKLEDCIQWAVKNGAIVDDRIHFRQSPISGISAVVEGILASEEPLIQIPPKLLITNEKAQESFQVDNRVIDKNAPNSLVQLYLAKLKFAKGMPSMYQPYIDLLPLKLEQPYFWDWEELQVIRGTDLYLVMKQSLPKLLHEWISILKKLSLKPSDDLSQLVSPSLDLVDYVSKYRAKNDEIPWNSFAAYVWSAGIFASRAFPKIAFHDQCLSINEAFLYPIVDFLNHKNDAKVRWSFQDGKMCFISQESLKSGEELFNNYGDKSNEELLLNYGFVQDNNQYDDARLTLRLDSQLLDEAEQLGVSLSQERVTDNSVQFKLNNDLLSPNLVQLFALVHKLRSEDGINLRNSLVGIDSLQSILMQKVEFFRQKTRMDVSTSRKLQILRKYFDQQRKLFQSSIENGQKLQKELIKSNSEFLTSFKTIFKNDKQFSNSLLLTFGVTKFDDLITKDCMNQILLLWIVRVANKNEYAKKLPFEVPQFIYDTFQEVSSTIVIEREDVLQMMGFYQSMFPSLSEKIPEIYGQGNWRIRQFIVADTVMDRLVWTRKLTQEPFFVKKQNIVFNKRT
ncbi:hypothetical protein ZYGM_002991 [Zygosaccharomyces mellis]|uniref:SET domain-containing protein n=1 Tax=Zygosaccharomyces mellis TaxID=42258 RepID=A0A4C2E8Z6_9SACH|nr:hypothetical protein ZYGM_002991 [Zygosaccharomyces mellis]